MTGINHALTGALVAVSINKPVIALPAAFLSHFAVDTIPHWNHQVPKNFQIAAVIGDLILTFAVVVLLIFILHAPAWIVAAGGVAGVLPDFMWLPEILQSKDPKLEGAGWFYGLRRFHHKIQWSETSWGIYVELCWFILLFTVGLIFIK